jgi:NADH-quinone oxidoreductase subunit A
MDSVLIAAPILLFAALALAVPVGMIAAGWLLGPRRPSRVKAMPYESGMDPIHDTRRRFDVRFYLVAIAFLLFDVELLFLYPWAVARGNDSGIKLAVNPGEGIRPLVESTALVFGEAMVFIALLALGFAYAWRRGVFRWR